jgi:transmembrane sensor
MKQQTAAPSWTTLSRFFSGDATAEEAGAVRQWLEATSHAGPVDVEAALTRVKSRFGEAEVVPLPERRRRFPVALRLAAALTLVAGAGLVWRLTRTSTEIPNVAQTYSTRVGQTDSLTLSDGTLAILGPASRLEVSAGYGAGVRGVQVEGVAWFDVTHDDTRPFRVKAGGAEIEDLGTRFGVTTMGDEVRVVVESGSVSIQDTVKRSARRVTLKAGEAATLRANQSLPAPSARTESDVAWLRGQLVFDNAPLARVREDLRRWYGLELVLADSSLLARHVSARFAGESSAQVLRVLELALGAVIERRGDTAVVRPAAPSRSSRP